MSNVNTQIYQVFISHSNKDTNFVAKLKSDLKNYFNVWIDDDIDCLCPGDSLLDKLDEALNDMTHFLIVCSPHSMRSEWVKKEYTRALERLKERGIAKVIPIKYRDCTIPKPLNTMLYADFSDIIFFSEANEFICATPEDRNKYGQQLSRVIKAIRQCAPEKLTEVSTRKRTQSERIDLYVKLVGYANKQSKMARIQKMKLLKGSSIQKRHPVPVFPIMLPRQFEALNLRLSAPIELEYSGKTTIGHFAGYRKDDLRIVLPLETRKDLQIKNLHIYRIKYDISDPKIYFFEIQ